MFKRAFNKWNKKNFSKGKNEEEKSLDFIDDYIKSFENKIKIEKNEISETDLKREINLKAFYKMGLMGSLCRNVVDNLKFNEPTEIQKKVIPFILKEKSVVASAETGTGKTAGKKIYI